MLHGDLHELKLATPFFGSFEPLRGFCTLGYIEDAQLVKLNWT